MYFEIAGGASIVRYDFKLVETVKNKTVVISYNNNILYILRGLTII